MSERMAFDQRLEWWVWVLGPFALLVVLYRRLRRHRPG